MFGTLVNRWVPVLWRLCLALAELSNIGAAGLHASVMPSLMVGRPSSGQVRGWLWQLLRHPAAVSHLVLGTNIQADMPWLPGAARSFIKHYTQLDNLSLDEDGPPRYLRPEAPDRAVADLPSTGLRQRQGEAVQRRGTEMDSVHRTDFTRGGAQEDTPCHTSRSAALCTPQYACA